jgi:hypothetical protein
MKTKTKRTIGYVVSAVPGIVMLLTAVLKLSHHPSAVDSFVHEFGISAALLAPLCILQLVGTGLYLAPRFAFLGAILLTGYLGGATVTELRAARDVWFPVLMGLFVWLGLALRDSRVAVALGRTEPIT